MGWLRADISPSMTPENGSFLHCFDNTFVYKIIKILTMKLIQSPCLLENKTVSNTPFPLFDISQFLCDISEQLVYSLMCGGLGVRYVQEIQG